MERTTDYSQISSEQEALRIGLAHEMMPRGRSLARAEP